MDALKAKELQIHGVFQLKLKTRDLPSQERLRQLFIYNFETGELINRSRRNFSAAGSRAGSVDSHGYRRIGIDGKVYAEHRIIWVWVYGAVPEGYLIDHINHNKLDNRIQNLRLATSQMNNVNIKSNRINKTGYRGVTKTRLGQFEARIKQEGKNKYLGTFNSALEAFNRYSVEKARRHLGDIVINEK